MSNYEESQKVAEVFERNLEISKRKHAQLMTQLRDVEARIQDAERIIQVTERAIAALRAGVPSDPEKIIEEEIPDAVLRAINGGQG